MPRPVSQYFSLPFNWHSIRSTSSLSSGALPDAGVLYQRPVKADTGGSSLPPGTAPEPAAQGVYVKTPRIKRNPSSPPGGLCPIRTRCLCGPLPGGRPVGQPVPGRVKSQAVASRPAESRICVLLHFRSACNVLAALQQRRGLPCCTLTAPPGRHAQACRSRARRLGVTRRR